MMQQISPQLPANLRERVPVGDQLGRKSAGLRYGEAMVFGEARQREDRAADCEVVSGMACGNDVWFIRSGILRLQRYGYDGRRQILSLFLPGEIVGVEGEFREGVSVETATRSSLCRIDRRKFNGMVDQNEVLRAELFRQKQDQLDRLHWLTWSLGALSAEERLCAFLALSSKFMPYHPLPDGTFVLSMCLARKDIADLLGTTVESISRIIHKLSDTGIIQIKDPAHFGVRDLNRLIEIGRIDGLFDRMIACGSKPFSTQGSIAPPTGTSKWSCSAQSGPLTPVNDSWAGSGIPVTSRNLPSGGNGK